MNANVSSSQLNTPSADLADLSDRLGRAWGLSCGEPLAQYLAWSESSGMLALIAECGRVTLEEVCDTTEMNQLGADALLCILACLKLVCRDDGGRYSLCGLAREYLLRESPYYIGDALYLDLQKSLPDAYLKMPTGVCASGGAEPDWPIGQRLRIQHSRNFAPSVIAARSGAFSAIRHLVDIAGGTGVLAIPLAMDRPDIRITLVDMPETLPYIRETLAGYGVEDRIKLVGLDVFKDRWDVGPCDGVHFGNFFHFVSDEQCRFLARKTFEILPRGGLVWLHEVLLNENRDGPILAVLWNANMIIRRPGARQRTASELIGFLRDVGFSNFGVKPTAGSFSLLSGVKV